MVKCLCCERILSNEDIDAIQDYRGEFWGMPAYETISICGFCKSDDIDFEYDPSERCEDCKYHSRDDLNGDWMCAMRDEPPRDEECDLLEVLYGKDGF